MVPKRRCRLIVAVLVVHISLCPGAPACGIIEGGSLPHVTGIDVSSIGEPPGLGIAVAVRLNVGTMDMHHHRHGPLILSCSAAPAISTRSSTKALLCRIGPVQRLVKRKGKLDKVTIFVSLWFGKVAEIRIFYEFVAPADPNLFVRCCLNRVCGIVELRLSVRCDSWRAILLRSITPNSRRREVGSSVIPPVPAATRQNLLLEFSKSYVIAVPITAA
mmetsp:Transcript_38888/g.85143  ORF Transcript_38888/g.85143 Transcript_38888/m.85143 type:complete len:217 (-) Transcript_38888:344-994(-)